MAKPEVTEPLPHFHEPATKDDDTTAEEKLPVIEEKKAQIRKSFTPKRHKINSPEPEEVTQEEEDFLESNDENNDSISEALLKEVWARMADKYQHQSLSLYTALTTYEPIIDKSTEIVLMVDNSVQENMVLENKSELNSFLRKELNNNWVQLKTSIVENNYRNKPLDPKEKLERLAKKNPHVKTLYNELGLDIFF